MIKIIELTSVVVILVTPFLKWSLIRQLKQEGKSFAINLQFSVLWFEMFTQIISLAYNIRNQSSFIAFGELYFLLLQNLVIMGSALYLLDGRSGHRSIMSIFIIVLLLNVLLNPRIVTDTLLSYMVGSGIPLTVLTILPAIITNYRQRNTLAFPLPMLLIGQFIGTFRIVTTVLLVSTEFVIVFSSCLGPVLNLILIYQHFEYNRLRSSSSTSTSTAAAGSSYIAVSTTANMPSVNSSNDDDRMVMIDDYRGFQRASHEMFGKAE